MSSENHPDFETLMLRQTGELEDSQARAVQRHIASCALCRETLDSLEDFYNEGDRANSLVAEQLMQIRLANENKRRRRVRTGWTSAVAAGLVAALLLYTIDFTPSAQAETLLHRAAARQAVDPFHSHTLRFVAGSQNCNVAFVVPDVPVIQPQTSGTAICSAIDRQLHSAGWSWNSPLSAKAFEQWRASLPKKHDAVHKTTEFTEVSTRTEDGPIHEATLRLRNGDYQTVAAKIQFASEEPESSIEIETAPYTPPVETASIPTETHTPRISHSVAEPMISPLDRSEEEVRLALHRTGADTNLLLAAKREGDTIRVWGVAPTSAAKESIAQSLGNIPNVSLAVVTAAEQQISSSPLPWQAAHGDGPPLAYNQINELFQGKDEEHQRLLNDLDTVTRRILAEAKSRDALLALAARDRSAEYGASLHHAADDLASKLLADQHLLVERLGPFYAAFQQPAPTQPSPLNSKQAMQVYLLVHRLLIADDSGGALTADTVFRKLEKLPL